MARRIIQEEGLLCGGSSGATLVGAIKWALAANLTEDDTVVVVMADNVRNYLTKHLSKHWMIENRFLPYGDLDEVTHPLRERSL
jgi:cystathionine beta-synthase